jgi:exodeoxyribonuclease VII large subunit
MSNPPTSHPVKSATPDAVLTVSQLNRLARQLLEDCFPMIWVEGEISNLSRPSSGHWYFTLKDASAQVRCAMFRNRNVRLRFQPKDGDKILVKGAISLYEARGDYQMIAEDMQPAGQGLLAARFDMLKQKLQMEGLFDPARKKPLPDSIRHLAVITSPTGAAIRDILTVLQRRDPAILVTVLPVPVQGDQAPAAIVRALATANRLALTTDEQPFDAILLGRGGGSLEDLWAFNDENVARAIAASSLPVISAVGHEVDFSIADFVADARAPTPSAAAELLSRDWRLQLRQVQGWQQRLADAWRRLLQQKRQQLAWQQRRLQHPGQRVQQWSLRLDELEMRLLNAVRRQARDRQQQLRVLHARLQRHQPGQQVRQLRTRLEFCQRQLPLLVQRNLRQHRQHLAAAAQLLHSVSPLATLQRGYAIVGNERGELLRDARNAPPGSNITARLAHGQLHCTVLSIETDSIQASSIQIQENE